MKKKGIALLSALMLTTAFGGLATIGASAAVEDVPEGLTYSNVALGKEVSFKSLTDMDVEVAWSAYWPDTPNFHGQEGFSMTSLTDGDANWGTAQNRSPQTANTHAWAYLDLGEEVVIGNIKVGYLAAWCFTNVVIQVSNDASFETGVTTVFAATETVYADDGETVVYNGGQVGCSLDTKDQTGWNGLIGVDSVGGGLRTYDANGVKARYVRLTNSDGANGGAANVTTINELQVYAVTDGVVAPTASVVSGSYESMTTVELTSAYDNAEIYYTLDGTYPTKNSTKYEDAIDASSWTGSVALRAIAVVDGKQSEAADYVYKLTIPSENVAPGKTISFRSLTDMSEEVAYGSYFPDATGFYGSQFNGDLLTPLTDGNAAWAAAQNRAPQTSGTHAWVLVDLGSEIEIENIKVGYLSTWCFTNVVIQVSNDANFEEGVTTVFACNDGVVYADDGTTVVYDGGQVGCSEETRALTGWNGTRGVDSVNGGLLTYAANGVKARYVRLTNSDGENGGAFNVTTICELEVWSKGGEAVADPEIKDTLKSVTAVPTELDVIPGTDVEALLPASVGYTTMKGATGEIALTWESADWQDMTEGTFTFTATPVVEIDDVFELVPASYSVEVTVAKADTSELDALIEEVEGLNSATYTQKTWSPLATLVSEAKEEINVITVTEETIATYIEDITTAQAALQELATDKTALAGAIETATAIDQTKYMSATVAGLDEALEAATAVNSDTDASVAEATAALNGLNSVLNGLVEKGDTTALAALVATIKEANYVEADYTEMSYATLVDALEDAEEILEATETPKTDVDAAYTALDNAKKGLVAYGDNTELAELIEECEGLVEADYTAGSYAAFETELTEASALLTQKVMQDVIDEAKEDLQAAKDGLVSIVALKAAIASTVEEDTYTAISVQVWKDAKAEAQLVLDNANATAQEVADAIAAIEAAEDALVVKPSDDVTPPAGGDDVTPPAGGDDVTPPAGGDDVTPPAGGDNTTGGDENPDDTTEEESGCRSVAGVASVGIALVGAAAVVMLKKKKED